MSDNDIKLIVDMGFTYQDAVSALKNYNNSVDQALDYLLSRPEPKESINIPPLPSEPRPSSIKIDKFRKPSADFNSNNKADISDASAPPNYSNPLDEKVEYLLSLGFSRVQANFALQTCRNDVESAADFLFNSPIIQDPAPVDISQQPPHTYKSLSIAAKVVIPPVDDEPDALHYGDIIQLFSNSNDKLMIAKENDLFLENESDIISKGSLFKFFNPKSLSDTSVIKNECSVVISIVQEKEAFLAIEGDCSISSNRPGPIEIFMKWTISRSNKTFITNFAKSDKYIYVNEPILLGSSLNSTLSHDDSRCFGLNKKNNSKSIWRSKLINPESPIGAKSRGSYNHLLGSASRSLVKSPNTIVSNVSAAKKLWGELRINYKIAGIRVLKQQSELLDKKIDHDKQLLKRSNDDNADKKECTMCWEKTPDTVLLECGHICLCSDCAPIAKDCPLCRKNIFRFIVIQN